MDSVLRFRTVPCVALNDADYSTWVWTPRRISCNKLSFFRAARKPPRAPHPHPPPEDSDPPRSAGTLPAAGGPASRAARASRVTRTHAERYPLRKHVSVTKKVQDKPKIQKISLPTEREARSVRLPVSHKVTRSIRDSRKARDPVPRARIRAHTRTCGMLLNIMYSVTLD